MPAFYTEVAADSPVGWWKLNETSGTTIANAGSVGGSNTITNVGTTRNHTGLVTDSGNKAILFDGTNQAYVTLLNTTWGTSLNSANALTVEGIFKFSSTAGRATFLAQNADSTGYLFTTWVSNNNIHVTCFVNSYFDTFLDVETTVPYVAGQWYHIAHVWSSSGFVVYINGAVAATLAKTNYTWVTTTAGTCNILSRASGGYDQSRNCTIDEIIVYKASLSAARVLAHYEAAFGMASVTVSAPLANIDVAGLGPGLVGDGTSSYANVVLSDSPSGYWKLDETSGSPLDSSGNAHTATIVGTVTQGASNIVVGAAGSSYDFGGGYLTVPDAAALDLTGTYTIEAWIRKDALGEMAIVSKYVGSDGYSFYSSSADKLVCSAIGTITLAASTVYHVVVVHTSNQALLYVNGQLDVTDNNTVFPVASTATLKIGALGQAEANARFDGKISHVALYNSPLSAARVLAHYNAGSPISITQTPPVADITVAGLAPAIEISAVVSADVADVSVAAADATITTVSNVIVSVDLADVAVAGFSPTVSTGVALTVTSDPVDVSVMGHGPDLSVGTEVATATADVAVAGLDAEVVAVVGVPVVGPRQFLRPDGDTAIAWQRSSGNNQWSLLDEVVPNDDIDYIYLHYNGNFAPGGTYAAILSLTSALDPTIHTGHTVRVRYKGTGLAVHIYQGTTWIYGWNVASVATWTTTSFIVPTDAAAQITDYNDLRVALVAGFTYSLYASDIRVSWVELELPEAGLSHVQIDTSTANVSVAGLAAVFDDGATGVAVLAEVANVLVAGLVPSFSVGEHAVVSVETADVVVQGPSPDVITPGSVSLGVDPGDVIVAGQQTELTTDRTVEFLAEVVDVLVGAGDPSVRTGPDQLSFRFVADTYTGLSALDAAAMNQLDFGPLLHGQTKTLRFRLGNDSPMTTHFLIRAVSENAGVADWVTFSPNNILYTPFIIVESVPGNGLTDVVWCRIHVATDAAVGVGNVLIEVEQIVA